MMTYTYEYPRPMVTVDVAVFARVGRLLEVLLIERGIEPCAGAWALPGGFIHMDEKLLESAKRELVEETGITPKWLAPACFAGDPGRDPRGRTVSAVYYTVFPSLPEAKAGDDAANLQWFDVKSPPPLAFDHAEVLASVLREVEKDALTTQRVFDTLPAAFTADDFAEACAALPGLSFLEPDAHRVLDHLTGAGMVARIDAPESKKSQFRFNRNTWGKGLRPWLRPA